MSLYKPFFTTGFAGVAGFVSIVGGAIVWKKYDMNYKTAALLLKFINPFTRDIFGDYVLVNKFIIPTRIPYISTLKNVIQISEKENKRFDIDYWNESLNNEAIIGVNKEKNMKILAKYDPKKDDKTAEYYTSPIKKIYGSEKEYIIVTAVSVFVVDKNIKAKVAINEEVFDYLSKTYGS